MLLVTRSATDSVCLSVRIICTASAGARLTFSGAVEIAAFGGFMIRGEGTALGFEEAGNAEFSAIIDFQAPVSAAAESSISVSVQAASLEFQDSLNMELDSSLHIEGAINYLRFAGGVHLAPGSSASIVSSTARSIKVALGTPWYAIDPTHNRGSFSLQVSF